MKSLIYGLTIIIIIIISIGLVSCKKDQNRITVKTEDITFTKEGQLSIINNYTKKVIAKLDIEFAETAYETQTGLMYRNSMAQNQGMLFIFKDERPRSFYMKNTRIPLDIIYLDTNKEIVSFQENAQPLNKNSLPSNKAAKYVLEVNAGLVKQWQLKIGNFITFTKL